MLLRPAIASCEMTAPSDAHVTSMSSAGSSPSMFQPFPPLPKSPFSSPCGSPKASHSGRNNAHKGTGPCSGRCKAHVQGTQHFCAPLPPKPRFVPLVDADRLSVSSPQLQAPWRLPRESPDAGTVGCVNEGLSGVRCVWGNATELPLVLLGLWPGLQCCTSGVALQRAVAAGI